MRIAWQNNADSAIVVAGSQINTLPATNVQQPHLSRKWHTSAGVRSSYLLFDLGAALSCSVLAALGTNFTADATLRLRASTADATAVSGDLLDTGIVSAGVNPGYGAVYFVFNAVTARYWRADFAANSVPDNLQVGRVFLGPSWKPSSNQEYGWSISLLDDSQLTESYGLQTYADQRPQRRLLKFGLNWLDEVEMYGNALEAARAAGRVKDVLAIHDSLGGAYLTEQSVFGLLSDVVSIVHEKSKIFRTQITIKERL